MSVFGILNEPTSDDFTVVNQYSELVNNIDVSEFTHRLYDSDGTDIPSSSIPLIIENLNNGNYRCTFVPNKVGLWYLVVYHPFYFPWGKSGDIQVYESRDAYDSACTSGHSIQRTVGKLTKDRLIYPL